jgi:RNA polymerase sigma factor (sigma-70 family)
MDGDEGFRDFVATYGAALSRSAFLLTGDHQLAEDLLQTALAQLPPRQRAVIVLRFLDDLSEAATAQAMGCSVGTVKAQAHAALARLRTLAPTLLADGREHRPRRADSPAGGGT